MGSKLIFKNNKESSTHTQHKIKMETRGKCTEVSQVRKYLCCILQFDCGFGTAQKSRLEVFFPQNVEGSAPAGTGPRLLLRSSMKSALGSKSLSREMIVLSGKLLRCLLDLWLSDDEP